MVHLTCVNIFGLHIQKLAKENIVKASHTDGNAKYGHYLGEEASELVACLVSSQQVSNDVDVETDEVDHMGHCTHRTHFLQVEENETESKGSHQSGKNEAIERHVVIGYLELSQSSRNI